MFERSYLRHQRLFMFVHHYASRKVSCGMLTKVCRARINYIKLSCFLHYPHMVWSHIFTGCSQGGKVIFGNTLCTFKPPSHTKSEISLDSSANSDPAIVTVSYYWHPLPPIDLPPKIRKSPPTSGKKYLINKQKVCPYKAVLGMTLMSTMALTPPPPLSHITLIWIISSMTHAKAQFRWSEHTVMWIPGV